MATASKNQNGTLEKTPVGRAGEAWLDAEHTTPVSTKEALDLQARMHLRRRTETKMSGAVSTRSHEPLNLGDAAPSHQYQSSIQAKRNTYRRQSVTDWLETSQMQGNTFWQIDSVKWKRSRDSL